MDAFFISPNYALCKSNEEQRQIIIDCYCYGLIPTAPMVTLVTEVVII